MGLKHYKKEGKEREKNSKKEGGGFQIRQFGIFVIAMKKRDFLIHAR